MIRLAMRIVGRDWQMQGRIWEEDIFRYLLTLEHRRSKRSSNSFALMVLKARKIEKPGRNILQSALLAVASSTRETDLIGWIERPRVLGIIFTQLDSVRGHPNLTIVRAKLERALREKLGREVWAYIAISSRIIAAPIETLRMDSTIVVLDHSSAIQ